MKPDAVTEVVAFEGMDDPIAIKHLMGRHAEALAGIALDSPEPDRLARGEMARIRGSRRGWDLWHAREHERGEANDHEH